MQTYAKVRSKNKICAAKKLRHLIRDIGLMTFMKILSSLNYDPIS